MVMKTAAQFTSAVIRYVKPFHLRCCDVECWSTAEVHVSSLEVTNSIVLCLQLGVKSTPSFYLYRAHPFIQVEDYELKWTGAKEEKFVGHVQSLLKPHEAGYDEANVMVNEEPAAKKQTPIEEPKESA